MYLMSSLPLMGPTSSYIYLSDRTFAPRTTMQQHACERTAPVGLAPSSLISPANKTSIAAARPNIILLRPIIAAPNAQHSASV